MKAIDRAKIIENIGQQFPSYTPDKEDNSKKSRSGHKSQFIITLPHAIFDGINQHKFLHSKNINSFKEDMKSLQWEIQNKESVGDKPLQGSEDLKKYITNKLFPILNKSNQHDFFIQQKNLYFSLNNKDIINQTWELHYIDRDDTKQTILFTIDKIDLWIMDNNICFYVLDTSFTEEQKRSISEISSIFNLKMRSFRELSIDFSTKEITHKIEEEKDDTSFIEEILQHTLTKDEKNLLKISITDLKNEDLEQIYESSQNAKMISAIHCNLNTDFDLDEITFKEFGKISILEECSYLLGTFSSFPSFWPLESSEQYMYEQMKASSIQPFKYWNGIVLKDSIDFFGIKDGNFLFYDNNMENEVYFIYILNLHISIRIRQFEFKLIDEEFTDYNNHVILYQQMQRLKNEYFSDEIARKFVPNEINLKMQNGLKYLGVYAEVEKNIKNTLDITKSNLSLLVSVSGFFMSIVVVFSDDIQTYIKVYLISHIDIVLEYWYITLPSVLVSVFITLKLKPFIYKLFRKTISNVKYFVSS